MERDAVWDAIVVGAGPAGAVAARQLALQDKQVLLVEKARLPRDKVCGGCLGGAALGALDSIGLGDLADRCGGVPLATFTLASEGVLVCVPVGRRIALSRRTLDEALVNEAARAGVAVRDGTRVEFHAAAGELASVDLVSGSQRATSRAKVIVVATGLGSLPSAFSQDCAPTSRIGLSALVREPPCKGLKHTLAMALATPGYVGITEVEGGVYDIAAAVDPQRLAEAASPGRLVQDILEAAGIIPAIDLKSAHWLGTPRMTRRVTPLAADRCILIGDAAGYVEPFTGEGIGWAIQSAILAASLLSGDQDRWDTDLPRRWQLLHDGALASRKRRCSTLTRALRLRPVRQIVAQGLRWAPSLARPIVTRLDRPFAVPR